MATRRFTMNNEQLEKRQKEIESKADFKAFDADFKHWHDFSDMDSMHLFRISAAWKSIQLLAEKADFVLSADEKREYRGLLDYRTRYGYSEIERADSHFSQVTI